MSIFDTFDPSGGPLDPTMPGNNPLSVDNMLGGQTGSKSLRSLLSNHGFSGDALEVGMAIVMAESGGRNVHQTGGPARGIWQFEPNTLSTKCAMDPVCATKAAHRISRGGKDWSKWGAFTNGSYRQYYKKKHDYQLDKRVGDKANIADKANKAIGDPLSGVNAIGQFFNTLGSKNFWQNAGKILIGTIIGVIGLLIFAHESGVSNPVKGAARAAAT